MTKRKIGIALKTSAVCAVPVLLLLALSCFITIQLQFSMSDTIIENYETSQKKTLERKAIVLDEVLLNNIKANLEICRSVTQNFLYNFDQTGLFTLLENFMKIEGILAIKVTDADGGNFGASWKTSEVVLGDAIPEDVPLDENLSVLGDAIHDNEKVGEVRIYFTRQFIEAEIAEQQSQMASAVEQFHQLFDENIEKSTIYQVFLSIGIIVILISVIMLSLYFIVTRPLSATVAMVKDIAEGEGDLTKRLRVAYNDEIGELACWFNDFVEKLQHLMGSISKDSSVVDSSSTELSRISGSISDGIVSLSDRSESVATAAEEMSANMNSVAAACEEAATNINMVAAAAEEMTNTINEIASSSELASTITTEAVEKSQSAVSRVNLLGDAAKDITKVTEVITEISGQTNLLALNATIEAARAGEAGKGFAVVANEIKDLAKQTADATLEIKEKINNIQTTTEASVTEIGEISGVISKVSEIVNTIAHSLDEQTSATSEISENVIQASKGIEEVNENVAQSSTVSQEIAREIAGVNQYISNLSNSSGQLDLSATDLSELASKLKKMVGKFKV